MKHKKLIIFLSLLFLIFISLVGYYFYGLSPVSNDEEKVIFEIAPLTSKKDIAQALKNEGLIRNQYVLDIYMAINKSKIQAGKYELSKSMKPTDMLKKFANGDIFKEEVTITFPEGLRVVDYADILSDKLSINKEDFINTINDSIFLKELINNEDYWFITDDILNDEIYYKLEGYLYPDTYTFYKDDDSQTVIKKILDNSKKQLDTLKDEINISGKSVHEILTVASILQVELSGNSKTDDSYKDNLKKIAQVIYKRINSNDTVGSDVTCYYGVRKKLSEELTMNDILDYNPYNTRLTDGRMNGKLPIGPISNPYIEAIDAVIHPSDTNYYFFVSNTCTGEMFFEESYVDFLNKVYELQSVCSSN